ncbi:hypothetical protein NQ317_011988 [Molorchus minor]|uniref:Uncharacterized protein n=1 Tax=Molorchus minor TaxID=1323400 RepID=A0ABQ9IYE3_9CUCU|nr:hypothetical protein NQ317_011988 [Molorchus minor]
MAYWKHLRRDHDTRSNVFDHSIDRVEKTIQQPDHDSRYSIEIRHVYSIIESIRSKSFDRGRAIE